MSIRLRAKYNCKKMFEELYDQYLERTKERR
jgi:hypothetical protein